MLDLGWHQELGIQFVWLTLNAKLYLFVALTHNMDGHLEIGSDLGQIITFRIEHGAAGSVWRFQGIQLPRQRKRARVGDDRILGHE